MLQERFYNNWWNIITMFISYAEKYIPSFIVYDDYIIHNTIIKKQSRRIMIADIIFEGDVTRKTL